MAAAIEAIHAGKIGTTKAAKIAGVNSDSLRKAYKEKYGVSPQRPIGQDLRRRVLARLLAGVPATAIAIANRCRTTPNVVRTIASQHPDIRHMFRGYDEALAGIRYRLGKGQPRGKRAVRPHHAGLPQGAEPAGEAL
jgi:hypothetical protein